MYRSRFTLSLLLTGTVVAGCVEESPVSPGRPPSTPVPSVNAPVLTPDDLVDRTITVREARPEAPGPARAELDGEAASRPLQQIFDAETRVGFEKGYAYALGRHDYIGNVGFVSTTAQVAHNDAYLGSQSAENQNYTPFLLDWGQLKLIWVSAKVYSDHECGLSVQGKSTHKAWWEFFQGTGVSEWGVDSETSQAAPVSQSCSSGGTGQTTSTDESGGMLCYYLITYDLTTGRILNAELLYCTTYGPKI